MAKGKPTIAVCGLGRCGTTLVMGMLDAAGVPTYADSRASFEADCFRLPCQIESIFHRVSGRAFKVLDPFRFNWTGVPRVSVIWIDRDHKQQARSQVKFMRWTGFNVADKAAKPIARSLQPDTDKSFATFEAAGFLVLRLRFEEILADPQKEAAKIAVFLGLDLDIDKMASHVRQRPPQCAPDCSIEEAAIAKDPERKC